MANFLEFWKTKPPSEAHPVGASVAEVHFELSLGAARDEQVPKGKLWCTSLKLVFGAGHCGGQGVAWRDRGFLGDFGRSANGDGPCDQNVAGISRSKEFSRQVSRRSSVFLELAGPRMSHKA